RLWSAQQALEYGLLNEVLPDDAALRDAARSLAHTLAQGPTRAFGEVKRLLAESFTHSLETQLEDEAQAITRCTKTDDAWQALNLVLAKQKPKFQGK
ncbi:MAG: enoyl-CoA hydratase-related protein, partial [Gammaproteobacteria bacterium]